MLKYFSNYCSSTFLIAVLYFVSDAFVFCYKCKTTTHAIQFDFVKDNRDKLIERHYSSYPPQSFNVTQSDPLNLMPKSGFFGLCRKL